MPYSVTATSLFFEEIKVFMNKIHYLCNKNGCLPLVYQYVLNKSSLIRLQICVNAFSSVGCIGKRSFYMPQ